MKNIVITGFMASGKTSCGQLAAQLLGREFVDTDALIETRTGKTVPQIFAEQGEPAFRALEAELCVELAARANLVIASGGGMLVDPANREVLAASSHLVCLRLSLAETLNRLNNLPRSGRPMLASEQSLQERTAQLYQQRQPAYDSIPWQITCDGLTPQQIAGQIAQIARGEELPVRSPEGAYPIFIQEGLLTRAGWALRAAGLADGSRVVVVSNPTVAPLYAEPLQIALQSAGFQPCLALIPDGEAHKTLPTLANLYEHLLDLGLDRSGAILALGGGVTGDVAGFAAASFMRGVRFVQMPTTLLSMVDASVGGKTGVDLPRGKNLVGAFKQPECVLIDPLCLQTLPVAELRSGMAEVIKHAALNDPDLFSQLVQRAGDLSIWWQESASQLLARAVSVKIKVVEADPFEKGQRALLNLGHTTGHALEQLSGFELRHGEGVAIGMLAAARIAALMDLADPALQERLRACLQAWELPVTCPPLPAADILAAMRHDKKKQASGLRWILPIQIGQAEINNHVPDSVILDALVELGARREP
jgi:3-dehydroquinate synthase